MSPGASHVAERANVGLRTVFRHFEDMDSIYDEMTEEVMTAIMPKVKAPFKASTWRERLLECVDRRADVTAHGAPRPAERPPGALSPGVRLHRIRPRRQHGTDGERDGIPETEQPQQDD